MQKLLTVLVFSVGLFSCGDPENIGERKSLDFGYFTIETPSGWKKIKERGIDSYVGRIAIDQHDTLNFDLGWYSNDLTEYQEVKLSDGKTYYISSNDTAYSPTLVDSANKHKVVKSTATWDTIDGRRAKILSPIKSGIGTTGIYIDSLWQAGADVDKFNMYGANLKPENEKAVLAAFRTLKFHKKQ